MSTPAIFANAVEAHKAGRLDEALRLYRETLEVQPTHAFALHNLGRIAIARGNFNEASDWFHKALAQEPARTDIRLSLADIEVRLGRIDAARRHLDRILEFEPDNARARLNLARLLVHDRQWAEALNELEAVKGHGAEIPELPALRARVLLEMGRGAEAEEILDRALAQAPGDLALLRLRADADTRAGRAEKAIAGWRRVVDLSPEEITPRLALAGALQRDGRLAEATAVLDDAARRAPGNAAVHNARGKAFESAGRIDDAQSAYEDAIRAAPESSAAYSHLARLIGDHGRHEDAVPLWERAAALAPDDITTQFCFANALNGARQHRRAIKQYEAILARQPDYFPAQVNVANAYATIGRTRKAISFYEQVLARHPDFAEVHSNLGNMYKDIGRAEESLAHYRRAVELKPSFLPGQSNLLMAYHYAASVDAEMAFREHQRIGLAIAGRADMPPPPDVDRSPERQLRVAYLSPDFRAHPVAYFVEPLLRAHNREAVAVYAYHLSGTPDHVTARIRNSVDHWREVRRLSDDELEARLRADKIDILVELTGHTANNRLAVMARRPAPVQVSYLGYPDTTGIPAIGYRLTDAVADPPAADRLSTETLIRLPDGFHCYQPPSGAPSVGPLPATTAGHITFGSFNNLAKTNPEVLGLWAEILHAVPTSRLTLKSRCFNDEDTASFFTEGFAELGIDGERISLLTPVKSTAEHLAQYNAIDIALDTSPYNGTTTTCEALYMGVPVITLAGGHHVGRVGASLLNAYGLTELIAPDRAGYVALAAALANDRDRLSNLRAALRAKVKDAASSDPERFAQWVEAAYRDMWRRFCLQKV